MDFNFTTLNDKVLEEMLNNAIFEAELDTEIEPLTEEDLR